MPPKIVPPAPRRRCVCGQGHEHRHCFHLNPRIRPASWTVGRGMIATINQKLAVNPRLRQEVLALGYEHFPGGNSSTRLSLPDRSTLPVASSSGGVNHTAPAPAQGSAVMGSTSLTPGLPIDSATAQWVSEKAPAQPSSAVVPSSPSQLTRIDLPRPRSTLVIRFPGQVTEPSSDPAASTEAPAKKKLEFLDMPNEIIEKIVGFVFLGAVEDHPEYHMLVHNEASNRPRNQRKIVFPRSVRGQHQPRNIVAPAGLTGRRRTNWLWHHPGLFARPFEVMFAARLFYEMALPIRYREVHVEADYLGTYQGTGNVNLLCGRLSNNSTLRQYTKEAHFKLPLRINTLHIQRIVEVLQELPMLRHVCVSFKVARDSVRLDRHLLEPFFAMGLESFSIIWGWGGSNSDIDKSTDPKGNADYAPIPSIAEKVSQEYGEAWIRREYKSSSWYLDPEDDHSPHVPQGKARHIHDLTATRRSSHPGKSQWDMDHFIFSAAGKLSEFPSWNLWEGQRNHPSQVGSWAPVKSAAVWPRGWGPYPHYPLKMQTWLQIR